MLSFSFVLNFIFSSGPPSHIEMVKKLKDNLKDSQKQIQGLLKELATIEAQQIKNQKYLFLHRKDGVESEFISMFLRLVKSKSTFLFLTTVDSSGKGKMILQGSEIDVDQLGPVLCTILEGKGNGKHGRYQAKINNIKLLPLCESKIKNHFGETLKESE